MVAGSGVVVAAALSQLGKPYAWDTPLNPADPDPATFDCSGLTEWCYHKAGVSLTHFSGAQYVQLKHRRLSEAMPGDLVFFGTLGSIYHVALYIGNSKIVEAPDYGIPVRIRVISPNSTDILSKVGAFPGSQTADTRLSRKPQPVTYRDFFANVLTQLGAPVTDANLYALANVAVIEGQNDRYNPLNSVVPAGGSTSFNSVGVQDYGNYRTGVSGTVTLLRGDPWRDVLAALRQGDSSSAVIGAFSNAYAGWGSHPRFSDIDRSQERQLLQSRIGVTRMPTIPSRFGDPPFKPKDLTVPLTANQRERMITWLTRTGGRPDILQGYGDTQLLDVYTGAYSIWLFENKSPVTGPPGVGTVLGWAQSLGKLLGWLIDPKNWVRIGTFALGAIILIFAAWKGFSR